MPGAKVKEGKKERKISKHWIEMEIMWFFYSLIILEQYLERDKMETKFYKQIQKFTQKDPIQNRTHRDKMVQDYQKCQCPERQFLYKFYYQKFIIRHLDEEQLKKELRIFINGLDLTEESKASMIRKSFYNLEKLELEKHARAYKFKGKMVNGQKVQDQIYSQLNAEFNAMDINEIHFNYLDLPLAEEQIGSTESLPCWKEKESALIIEEKPIPPLQMPTSNENTGLFEGAGGYLVPAVHLSLNFRFKSDNSMEQFDYNDQQSFKAINLF